MLIADAHPSPLPTYVQQSIVPWLVEATNVYIDAYSYIVDDFKFQDSKTPRTEKKIQQGDNCQMKREKGSKTPSELDIPIINVYKARSNYPCLPYSGEHRHLLTA